MSLLGGERVVGGRVWIRGAGSQHYRVMALGDLGAFLETIPGGGRRGKPKGWVEVGVLQTVPSGTGLDEAPRDRISAPGGGSSEIEEVDAAWDECDGLGVDDNLLDSLGFTEEDLSPDREIPDLPEVYEDEEEDEEAA